MPAPADSVIEKEDCDIYIKEAFVLDIASKRQYLSNPTCSFSGTWGTVVIVLSSASKMPHTDRGCQTFPSNCAEKILP